MIRQQVLEGSLDAAVKFWMEDVGVDEVITRKFLSWDDNTTIPLSRALDPHLYKTLPAERKEPCVWPFERMNVDTLGRVALCGQDISFRTARPVPERQRQDAEGNLAGRAVQLVSSSTSGRTRRRGMALPRLLGLACWDS